MKLHLRPKDIFKFGRKKGKMALRLGLEHKDSKKCFIFALALIAMTAPAIAQFDVVLRWTPNSETDLAGYNVYRSDASTGWQYIKINSCLVTTATFQDHIIGFDEKVYYAVSAVDTSENESVKSDPVFTTTDRGIYWQPKPHTPTVIIKKQPAPKNEPTTKTAPTTNTAPANSQSEIISALPEKTPVGFFWLFLLVFLPVAGSIVWAWEKGK